MKLLNKTVRYYFLLSVIVLLVAIPVFYFVLKKIVIANVDARLVATKTQLIPRLQVMEFKNGEPVLGNDITLEKAAPNTGRDSLYTADTYRLLTSHLVINRETYRLRIKSSIANHERLITSIIILQVLLLTFLLAGLLLVNRSLSRKVWDPFYKTLQKLRAYKVDDPGPLQLAPSSINEFAELNTALEQLAERSRQAYIAQKEFAENASHEMRTPLAIFQGKLELLMQTDPLSEEQAGLITDLATASQRMARLNKGLILLTRIQNGQFPETENVSVRRTAENLLEQYQPQLQQKELTVQREWTNDLSVSVNPTLMEVLLGNLLANAIRHNIPRGNIIVRLAAGTFTVQNTGQPFALPEERIFHRFSKQSTDADSMGLGLEIVRKICDLYGFSITYQYAHPLHTFRVQMQQA
ncbi:sensor histidine kinase [Chitinophaga lutea]|uniref:histidine kinase n=1 Tax=Chitinophaga lutea TaxID=2488634 RepID=A0A3N4QDT5_9BACT|nr:HAMP domain-containing sensor histidine kinase [Chitinophaga lutea]RPE14130.1 sensor histidine kinase [Chitinophaga lutea]